MLPSAGGVRVAHRAAAINGRSGFCGFPKFAHSLAKSTTSRTFSDKVPLRPLPLLCCQPSNLPRKGGRPC